MLIDGFDEIETTFAAHANISSILSWNRLVHDGTRDDVDISSCQMIYFSLARMEMQATGDVVDECAHGSCSNNVQHTKLNRLIAIECQQLASQSHFVKESNAPLTSNRNEAWAAVIKPSAAILIQFDGNEWKVKRFFDPKWYSIVSKRFENPATKSWIVSLRRIFSPFFILLYARVVAFVANGKFSLMANRLSKCSKWKYR